MILARVCGNIVATKKNHRYDNASIMLCQQITPEGDETANTVIALNAVDAGVGDMVLIVQEGWGASTASTGKAGAAIDSAIVGVVDYVDLLK
jgi:ethanolamine utilization protein EutN